MYKRLLVQLTHYRTVLLLVVLLLGGSCSALTDEAGSSDECRWDSLVRAAHSFRESGNITAAQAAVEKAMELATSMNDAAALEQSHIQAGLLHHFRFNYEKAWSHWMQAMRIAEASDDQDGLAELYNYLGVLQYDQKDHRKALSYFYKSLEIRSRIGTPVEMALLLNNIGALEEEFGDLQVAMDHYRNSYHIWRKLGRERWMAMTHLNMGTCHRRSGMLDSALWYLQGYPQVVEINAMLRSKRDHQLGLVRLEQGNLREAIRLCGSALSDAKQLDQLELQRDCAECLYRVYAAAGDVRNELEFFRKMIELRDSTSGQEHQQQMAWLQAGYEMEKRLLADSLSREEEKLQAELSHSIQLGREKERRNILFFSTIGVLLLAAGLYNRLRFIRRSRELVRAERDRADRLLHNILPGTVAEELMATGHAEAKEFAQATVLFTDFEGFTGISEQLTAKELVAAIDDRFKEFDKISRKYNVEKIKTVGDCYMACGGVPDPQKGSPAEVLHAALELQRSMIEHKRIRIEKGLPYFAMRVGVHTGPVVAGIVGSDKFAYDIWGDTVNTAARMENTGQVGKVNISASTYELVRDLKEFRFTPRGMVQTKGKGKLQMFFVEFSAENIINSAEPEAELIG